MLREEDGAGLAVTKARRTAASQSSRPTLFFLNSCCTTGPTPSDRRGSPTTFRKLKACSFPTLPHDRCGFIVLRNTKARLKAYEGDQLTNQSIAGSMRFRL